jgi:hypothetical protein
MLRSDDDLSDSVSLGDTHYITPSPLVKYSADFAMVAPVGHAFVDTRIYLDNNTGSRLILMQQLAQPQFAMLSRSFGQEATCT